jgi:hypothetical protein
MRFVKGFARILRAQFCSIITQKSRSFLPDSSTDMNEKSQYVAEMRRVVRWEEPKPSVSTVVAHKKTGGFHRPLRAEIPNGILCVWHAFASSSSGRISIYEMKDCSPHEQSLLKNC